MIRDAKAHRANGRRMLVTLAFLLSTAANAHAAADLHSLVVTATAYNSLAGQTEGDPSIGAWGDRLEPGMRAIAVSRDLLAMGLTRGTEVEIEGLPGRWRVLDKMAARWTQKIDVYMGLDREAARTWGVKKVRITWRSPTR